MCKLFLQEESYSLEKAEGNQFLDFSGFFPKNVSSAYADAVLKDLNKMQELDLSYNGFTNLDRGLGKICIEIKLVNITIVLTYLVEIFHRC